MLRALHPASVVSKATYFDVISNPDDRKVLMENRVGNADLLRTRNVKKESLWHVELKSETEVTSLHLPMDSLPLVPVPSVVIC